MPLTSHMRTLSHDDHRHVARSFHVGMRLRPCKIAWCHNEIATPAALCMYTA